MEPLPEDKMSNYITGMVNDCYPIVYCWNTLSNINESGVSDHFYVTADFDSAVLLLTSLLFAGCRATIWKNTVLQLYNGIAFFSVNKHCSDIE